MDPLFASTLVGTGGNLLGQLGNIFGARRANKRMVEFWKMQNEYNHPKNQMARLQEAGLNPNLVYGQGISGATGLAGDVGRPERAQFDSPVRDITRFQDVRLRTAQTDNVQSQNTVNQQKAALTSAQTANEIQKGRKSKVSAELAEELKSVSAEAARMSLRKQEAETIASEVESKVKGATAQSRVLDAFYRMQNATETLKGQRLLNAIRKEQLDLKKMGIEPSDFWLFRFLIQNSEFLNRHIILKD